MPSYYVYILLSNKNRHYIGFTSDLAKRISRHNRKHNGFTGPGEKWELLKSFNTPDKISALKLEKYLKSLKNSSKALEYLEKLPVQNIPA